jgi:hypothetical protein
MTAWLPEWLFEGQLLIYAILAAALVFLTIGWKQTPRKSYLVGIIALAVLLVLYYVLDLVVVTDREQIRHALNEMSAGVEARSIGRIFDNVSDTYNRHGMSKEAFRQVCTGVINARHVDRVAMWGCEFAPGYKQRESQSDARETIAKVRFQAKPEGASGVSLYQVDAVFHRDTDGKWRLQSWEVFDPYHNDSGPLRVPDVP